MRRILIPTSVIFVLKGTDDKTLQLVQMNDWVYMAYFTDAYVRHSVLRS